MFNFGKVTTKRIDKRDVLDNQQMIFEYYFGQSIENKKRYTNPLRPGDNHPGCFFRWKGDMIRFYDYAGGLMYDVFSFVQALYNCDFAEALNRIQQDFDVGRIHTKAINKPMVRLEKDIEDVHKIQFQTRSFTLKDLRWWGDYLITEDELKQENIYSLEKLYIDGFKVSIPDLCFAYYYPEIDRAKIYKPLERKEFKWYSNVPFTHIDGLNDMPQSSTTALVAKSKKDKIVLRKLHADTCATQAENYHAIPEEADEFLNSNYERKVCFFDNDTPGKEANKKLNQRGYGWVNLENYLYECCKVKDPSDYVKVFNEYTYIQGLLKNKGII